ncbi:AAA family ATPase [Anaerobiospirillum succiniciproducens]|uniref:AAA family ATPase n=1 Tax=Anaerobiospirillum succiniciproducens TaxID=13335 RepID=UPI003F8CEBF5
MGSRLITNGFVTSFEKLIKGSYVYVDKTKFACELANTEGAYLLTRPRRMGKSTMVLTLEYLFSKGTVGTEGLYCHDHWPDKERYFVFRFAFNEIKCCSYGEFKDKLFQLFSNYTSYFGIELNRDLDSHLAFKQLIEFSVKKLSDEGFLAQHPELQDVERPLCTDNVVLLIDEYDAPLAENLDNSAVFNEIKEEYKALFSTIKNITNFRFVFLAGVSSYAQTSIFSGANQFINISLDDDYATCCGYTQQEIERSFAPELVKAQTALNLSYDELMAKLSYFYDGYLFCTSPAKAISSNKIFNPVSVSLFLTKPEKGFINYWSKTGAKSTFLFKLLKLCSEVLVNDLLKKLFADVPETDKSLDPSVTLCVYNVVSAKICNF